MLLIITSLSQLGTFAAAHDLARLRLCAKRDGEEEEEEEEYKSQVSLTKS